MTVQIVPFRVFDADQNYTVSFRVTGSQSTKHTINVYNNNTGVSVYTDTKTDFGSNHMIPAETLENGTSYYCTVIVYDANNDSAESSPISFLCLTTPNWSVSIAEGAVIRSTSVSVYTSFQQAEDDLVDRYRIYFYTSSGALVFESSDLYTTGS